MVPVRLAQVDGGVGIGPDHRRRGAASHDQGVVLHRLGGEDGAVDGQGTLLPGEGAGGGGDDVEVRPFRPERLTQRLHAGVIDPRGGQDADDPGDDGPGGVSAAGLQIAKSFPASETAPSIRLH